MMNKRAMSPLVATILLVVFALIIGTATMNWGKAYVEKAENLQTQYSDEILSYSNLRSSMIISIKDIDTPLKELQIKHITGKLSQDEYVKEEKKLLSS